MSKRYLDNLMFATFNMNDPEWIQKKCRWLIGVSRSSNAKGGRLYVQGMLRECMELLIKILHWQCCIMY